LEDLEAVVANELVESFDFEELSSAAALFIAETSFEMVFEALVVSDALLLFDNVSEEVELSLAEWS
jgi:hypothetical protein